MGGSGKESWEEREGFSSCDEMFVKRRDSVRGSEVGGGMTGGAHDRVAREEQAEGDDERESRCPSNDEVRTGCNQEQRDEKSL